MTNSAIDISTKAQMSAVLNTPAMQLMKKQSKKGDEMKIRLNSPEYFELVETLKKQLALTPYDEKIEIEYRRSISIMTHSGNKLTPDEEIISKASDYGLINLDELLGV